MSVVAAMLQNIDMGYFDCNIYILLSGYTTDDLDSPKNTENGQTLALRHLKMGVYIDS